jgi:hypothetical protein
MERKSKLEGVRQILVFLIPAEIRQGKKKLEWKEDQN